MQLKFYQPVNSKLFISTVVFSLDSAVLKISLLINTKMPTYVGIIYKLRKSSCSAQLSKNKTERISSLLFIGWKKSCSAEVNMGVFITSGPDHKTALISHPVALLLKEIIFTLVR